MGNLLHAHSFIYGMVAAAETMIWMSNFTILFVQLQIFIHESIPMLMVLAEEDPEVYPSVYDGFMRVVHNGFDTFYST